VAEGDWSLKKALLIPTFIVCIHCATSAQAYTPNDPYLSSQWGLEALGMAGAWSLNAGGSAEVTVAIVDTGVAWDHPDFAATNFDTANAWDFVDQDPIPDDQVGHGTNVTGIIAQTTGNGQGCAGVAYNCTILPLKVSNDDSLDNYLVAQAIDYAVEKGADLINLSLGSWYFDPVIWASCYQAYQEGVLIVAASGNDSNERFVFSANYPAYLNTTLVVGAIDSDYSIASYSNAAWDSNGPGVVAPGTGILQADYLGGYADYSGTSMAAAFVSGVAALVIAEAEQEGADIPEGGSERVNWIEEILYTSAVDLGISGADYEYGYGLVNAETALSLLQ
jgi:serine protease